MGNPRDPTDAWLNAEVEPLPPPPGTFERIRRRARRRKAGRAMMSAASIVIVVAAAVAVPRISSTLLESHNGPRRTAAAVPPPLPRASTPARGGATPNSLPGTRETQGTSSLSRQGSGNPVPPNFQPTSVTFVSQSIAAVIGQAGTPGHSAPDYAAHCTSVSLYSSPAGSDQWQLVPVPAVGLQLPTTGAGQAISASLVLVGASGGTGYLLAPSGELLSGPLTGGGWNVARPNVGGRPGPPGANGQPARARLAPTPRRLVLV